jgi:predicted protein tyrosine phosphatase
MHQLAIRNAVSIISNTHLSLLTPSGTLAAAADTNSDKIEWADRLIDKARLCRKRHPILNDSVSICLHQPVVRNNSHDHL